MRPVADPDLVGDAVGRPGIERNAAVDAAIIGWPAQGLGSGVGRRGIGLQAVALAVEIALQRVHAIGIVQFRRHHDVTTPIGESGTEDGRPGVALVVVLAGSAIAQFDFGTLEPVAQDDVVDAGDRIRAIGGCTANAQAFNALHHDAGNGVHVDLDARAAAGTEDGGRCGGDEAASIDQGQQAIAAQAELAGEVDAGAEPGLVAT